MSRSLTAALLCTLVSAPLQSQSTPEMQQVLERLERLERENKALAEEVRGLREDLAAARTPSGAAPAAQEVPSTSAGTPPSPPPSIEERMQIQEARVEELAQSKVDANQRFPLRLRGMLLFNAFTNSRYGGADMYPVAAAIDPGPRTAGATLRQSTLGFDFNGPVSVLGAAVTGSLTLDFFSGSNTPLNHIPRIRTAAFTLDWGRTKLMAGQEKPILSPREPTSLAQVGFSPLTQAGNLWLWQPQVRLEHSIGVSPQTELTAQVGVIQTAETQGVMPLPQRARPGLEGRFQLAHSLDDERRFEIAPGFHFSTTHVGGRSAPSRIASADWLVAPLRQVQFTGMLFRGQNVPVLGSLRPGYTFRPNGEVISVRSTGGWAQLSYLPTSRLTFNAYAGLQDDINRDLSAGTIARNETGAVNVLFRLAPNVLVSFEASQLRSIYLGAGRRRNNHYDLGLAYLF